MIKDIWSSLESGNLVCIHGFDLFICLFSQILCFPLLFWLQVFQIMFFLFEWSRLWFFSSHQCYRSYSTDYDSSVLWMFQIFHICYGIFEEANLLYYTMFYSISYQLGNNKNNNPFPPHSRKLSFIQALSPSRITCCKFVFFFPSIYCLTSTPTDGLELFLWQENSLRVFAGNRRISSITFMQHRLHFQRKEIQ